jgi:hypothetical protein
VGCACMCVCACGVCVCVYVCWHYSLLLSAYLTSQPGVRGLKTNRKREELVWSTVRGPGHKRDLPHEALRLGLGKCLCLQSRHKASLGPKGNNLEFSDKKSGSSRRWPFMNMCRLTTGKRLPGPRLTPGSRLTLSQLRPFSAPLTYISGIQASGSGVCL